VKGRGLWEKSTKGGPFCGFALRARRGGGSTVLGGSDSYEVTLYRVSASRKGLFLRPVGEISLGKSKTGKDRGGGGKQTQQDQSFPSQKKPARRRTERAEAPSIGKDEAREGHYCFFQRVVLAAAKDVASRKGGGKGALLEGTSRDFEGPGALCRE